MRISVLRLLGCLIPVFPAMAGNSSPPYGQYEMDASFWGGDWRIEDFANPNPNAVAQGRKLTRLANGDVIVAGLVSPYQSPDEGAGRNIGLVRYRPNGRRQAWSGPSPYLFSQNEFLIYPNSGPTFRYTDLCDIQVIDNNVYVLVQSQLDSQVSSTNVHVVGFRPDGSLLGEYQALGSSHYETCAGMVFVTPVGGDALLYVAGTTYFSGDVSRPTLVRFTRNTTDGTLVKDFSFGWAGDYYYQPPSSTPGAPYCSQPPCASTVNSIAHFRSLQGGVRIYLGGGVQWFGNDWDFLVIAVDVDGHPEPDFAGDGYAKHWFNSGGDLYDQISAIRVLPRLTAHDVFVAGTSSRNASSTEIAVMRLNSQGIAQWYATSGGCSESVDPPNCQTDYRSDVAWDMAITFNGNQYLLGVAGYQAYQASAYSFDPVFVSLDTDTGRILQHTRFPLRELKSGLPLDHAEANAIVPAGPHAFMLAGATPYPNEFVTTRIVVNKMFSDRFESNP